MSLNVPGVGVVPVEWVPSPDFRRGRGNYQPIAYVFHRAVSSSLAGIVRTLSTADTRPVSATFAIGWANGKPKIVQLVNLSDTPWTNGDCQQSRYGIASRWDGWHGHYAHNERSVTFEFEDNGGSRDPALKGIVDEPLILAAIEVVRLLRTGDIAAIRAAGFRIRDEATAVALAKIPPDARHLIDHNDIAGKGKPYCWRPWQADKIGFPRKRFIAALTEAPEAPDVPTLATYIPGQIAVVKAGMAVRAAAKLSATLLRVTSSPETWIVTGWVKGDIDPDGGTGRWLTRWSGGRWEYTSEANLASGPVAPPDPTPYSSADLKAAKKSGGKEVADAASLAASKQ